MGIFDANIYFSDHNDMSNITKCRDIKTVCLMSENCKDSCKNPTPACCRNGTEGKYLIGFSLSLKRLAPEIYCNDILLKIVLLLTLHICQPKKCPRDIGVLNFCGKSTPVYFS